MQFVIIARDGTDPEALNRRMAARPAHIEMGSKMRNEGSQLYGAALLDDAEKMIGSVLIVDFNSRAELDEWLKAEPYVVGKVWEQIEVMPCRVGPSFLGPLPLK
jgi:uncharacterized protein YciI